MSNTTVDINHNLIIAPQLLNIYFGLFIFLIGNFSTLCNLIVFTSSTFRNRAYSIYLIAESASTFIYFNYVLLTRIIQNGFHIFIIDHYNLICKTRQFLSEYTNEVAYVFFLLATIDRLLSTHQSHVYRNLSNRVTLAYKIVPLMFFIWFVTVGHRLILYSTSSGSCRPNSGIYQKMDMYFEFVISTIFPPIGLVSLSYFLLKNVRNVARRRVLPTILPIQIHHQTFIQQIDRQLTTMLILQLIVAIPSFLPFGIQLLYSDITENWSKTPKHRAWENVLIEVVRLLSYVFHSTSFYISFISNRGFRRQALQSLMSKKR